MKLRLIYLALGLMFLVAVAAQGAEYTVDPVHSTVGFQVKHLAISKVNGKFDTFAGTFEFEPGKPGSWSCEAVIETGSVDTGNEDRDAHLRNDDFFDAANHPTMTFKSTGVKMEDDEEGTITGELTIRGTTKVVELDLEFHGTVTDPWGNDRAGFTASGKINRQDFGLKFNKAMEAGGLVVSNDVKIVLEIEGIKSK